MSQSVLTMESVDGSLRANGHPFRLKGVVWWGAESARGLPGGLEHRSVDELLNLVQRYGFNAIKIPFLHQHILFDEPVPASSFDHVRNPYLLEGEGSSRPLKYIDALRVISRRAAGHGLLVWLVAHSLETLWYSRSISELTVLDSWTSVSRRLCPQWNIIGVDLKNLPSDASWGKNNPPRVADEPTDWDVAAAAIGNHVNAKCPRWLIGVQGVGDEPGAAQDPEMEFATMYPHYHDGENLVGARRKPVLLNDQSRLVYMPHSYGPGVRSMPYMETEDFPENSDLVWEEHFLFLRKRQENRLPAPLVLQIGGPFEGSPRDLAWQTWALTAVAAHSLNLFYDGLNPKSGCGGHSPLSPEQMAADAAGGARATPGGPRINNTGGLLRDDWTRAWEAKLQKLMAVPATRVANILRASAAPPPYLVQQTHYAVPPPSPPPPPPPPEQLLPISPQALTVVVVVLIVLVGQLGLFAKALEPLRRKLDACTPSALLPLLTLVWAVLNVPPPSAAVAAAALAAVPLPKSKKKGKKKAGDEEEEAMEKESLMMAESDEGTPQMPTLPSGARAERKKGGSRGAPSTTKQQLASCASASNGDSEGLDSPASPAAPPASARSVRSTGRVEGRGPPPPRRPERVEAPRRPVEAGCPRVCPRVEAGGRSSKACPSSRRPVPADEATDDDEEEEGEPSPREQRRKRAERFASRSFNPVAEEAEEARRRSMADPL